MGVINRRIMVLASEEVYEKLDALSYKILAIKNAPKGAETKDGKDFIQVQLEEVYSVIVGCLDWCRAMKDID